MFHPPDRRSRTLLSLAAVLTFALAAPSAAAAQESATGPAALARLWDAEHGDYGPPASITHGQLVARLDALVRAAPGLLSMEEIGRSVEGRSINHVWFGRGATHVLLWSQMHGDEPTATAALLDLLAYVTKHRAEPGVAGVLDALTVHIVPMLNPDGAERFQRRNAQGIDVNRDALLLQAPEGLALKALRDRLSPALGFNLHNQNWKTSAGKTKPATISLLAVAFDEPRTMTPGRLLAKRTCAVIRDALEALAPEQVARYDDEFEVRAFGDNLTKWGTPVVLIETGPYQGPSADFDLVRLNFVAIVTALGALADGSVAAADAARYETLPVNDSSLFTVLIKNASIVIGTGIAPFTGDIGLSSTRVVRPSASGGAREVVQAFRVDDLGDLRVFVGLETVDASGLFVVPDQGWKEGETAKIADWREFKAKQPIATGAGLDLALLRETAPGTYRVERIVRAERVIGGAPR